MWIVLLVIGIVGFVISKLFKESKETINVQGKSVFITGCDTGFGHGIAIRLDQLGMKVFAGCITEKGMEELRKSCSPNIHPLLCDITQADQIENAVKTISDACPDGLWGLVNNAGILVIGEWDWTCEQSLRKVMDVNFFGHVAITRAFLPLLKKSKGRIVNMTSLAGIVAISKLGAYSCAKFAMEAFSDSLRREMRKWGISVFIIEPGFSDTPMIAGLNSLLQQTWEEASETKKKEYGEEYGKLATEFKIRQLDPLNLVIDAFQDTLTLKYPKARARVGILAAIFYSLHTVLPTTWWDYLLEIDNRNLIPITVSKPTISIFIFRLSSFLPSPLSSLPLPSPPFFPLPSPFFPPLFLSFLPYYISSLFYLFPILSLPYSISSLFSLPYSPLPYSPLPYSPLPYSPLPYSPLPYSPLPYSPLPYSLSSLFSSSIFSLFPILSLPYSLSSLFSLFPILSLPYSLSSLFSLFPILSLLYSLSYVLYFF